MWLFQDIVIRILYKSGQRAPRVEERGRETLNSAGIWALWTELPKASKTAYSDKSRWPMQNLFQAKYMLKEMSTHLAGKLWRTA